MSQPNNGTGEAPRVDEEAMLREIRSLVALGRFDKKALRNLYPDLSEREFGLVFYAALRILREREGRFFRPRNGVYEEVTEDQHKYGRRRGRRRLDRAFDYLLSNIRGAQVAHRDDEGLRQRLNDEEVLAIRVHRWSFRIFRNADRKKPPGL